jgi:hypothetical protein
MSRSDQRKPLTRAVAGALLALFYILSAIGVAGIVTSAGTTSAEARGRGWDGGRDIGRGFGRGRDFGRGRGFGLWWGEPYDDYGPPRWLWGSRRYHRWVRPYY